jgi:hypothetical protein
MNSTSPSCDPRLELNDSVGDSDSVSAPDGGFAVAVAATGGWALALAAAVAAAVAAAAEEEEEEEEDEDEEGAVVAALRWATMRLRRFSVAEGAVVDCLCRV